MATVTNKPQIILKNGKPDAVILSLKIYKKLLEIAEEKNDVEEIKIMKQKKVSFRPIEEYLRRV